MRNRMLLYCIMLGIFSCVRWSAPAAGVTIITHGLNGNVDDWIIPMAEKIPEYPTFPGAAFSCYEIKFVSAGNGFRVTNEWLGGASPELTDSGEILIKLDWRQLANNDYSTAEVAAMVVPRLLQPDFIPALQGHALVAWPLHLIGHSRGGSLVCEMTRRLGLEGVWVDHVTTLDPHPLNNDGFMDIIYTVVDATAVTYENVLFADNYWQDIDRLIYGKSMPGAYNRKLTSLDGGYTSFFGGSHSDVHLWYHGTVELATPADDSAERVELSERNQWWTAFESRGTNAGFIYSRIGQGNRFNDEPPVPSRPNRIRDGMNQRWDFGAGTMDNRTTLNLNSGQWPNLIELSLTSEPMVTPGQTLSLQAYWQYGQAPGAEATIQVYLDPDRNPLNENGTEIASQTWTATGIDQVGVVDLQINLPAGTVPPGNYAVAGRISDGDETRWLYASQTITVTATVTPPVLTVLGLSESGFGILVESEPDRRVVLEASSDFAVWHPIATNAMSSGQWIYSETSSPADVPIRFYRALAE